MRSISLIVCIFSLGRVFIRKSAINVRRRSSAITNVATPVRFAFKVNVRPSRQLWPVARSNKTAAFLMIREQIRVHSAYAPAVAYVARVHSCITRGAVLAVTEAPRDSASAKIHPCDCVRGQIHGWLAQKSLPPIDALGNARVCGRLIIKADRFLRFPRRRFNKFYLLETQTHTNTHIDTPWQYKLFLLFEHGENYRDCYIHIFYD